MELNALSTQFHLATEELTLSAAFQLNQAKGIFENFEICPVRPALDELTI